MSHNENIKIANENREIIKTGILTTGVSLKLHQKEMKQVIVLTPDYLRQLTISTKKDSHTTSKGKIRVINSDSFTAAQEFAEKGIENVVVMNFANAIYPGGGYLNGSSAQEESLCRQSTLYASISSKAAIQMYQYNDKIRAPFDSDYMLLSPHVEVFRSPDNRLLHESFLTSVMTSAAPNLFGRAANATEEEVAMVMKHRIRNYLLAAKDYGYQYLVLGAWGCGAFGHDAKKVAGYYHTILFEEGYLAYFKELVFAVLDTTNTMYNYQTFLHTFQTTQKMKGGVRP